MPSQRKTALARPSPRLSIALPAVAAAAACRIVDGSLAASTKSSASAETSRRQQHEARGVDGRRRRGMVFVESRKTRNVLSTLRALAVSLSLARATRRARSGEISPSRRKRRETRRARKAKSERKKEALSLFSPFFDVDTSRPSRNFDSHFSLPRLSLPYWSCPPNHHRFSSAPTDAGAADFGLAAADPAIAAAGGQKWADSGLVE